MDKTKKIAKRCVICNASSLAKDNQWIFYYDPELKDYHCSMCDQLVREAVELNGSSRGLKWDWHQRKDWYTKIQEFEKTLDFDISEEAIRKILEDEILE